MNSSTTTIPVSKDTRTKLQTLMKYGQTYDGIIRYLLENQKLPLEVSK
jgi:hypothetical protein